MVSPRSADRPQTKTKVLRWQKLPNVGEKKEKKRTLEWVVKKEEKKPLLHRGSCKGKDRRLTLDYCRRGVVSRAKKRKENNLEVRRHAPGRARKNRPMTLWGDNAPR